MLIVQVTDASSRNRGLLSYPGDVAYQEWVEPLLRTDVYIKAYNSLQVRIFNSIYTP